MELQAADFNRDNVIDICDVIILIRATNCNKGELMDHLLGKSPLSETRKPSFDFNQDGVIDSADLIDIILNPRCCN